VRYLIDADKLVFTDAGISYQAPDGPAPIKYDKYDYSTDEGVRHYFCKGQERPFHDIGQVRKSDAGPVYEYYSLNGSKMWITNGSISTQLCLYAQTPEGVTGFLVDRHAEGLKVGADEKKTGQRGSPTNEIAIDSVRVPREAVIGYEGHGQVNALESLNVGRCGLAVVSGALMRKLMQEAETDLPASPERDDLLGEAAAVLFGSESLAYYLIGLFDRPFESVRMESAIAKYLCSEDIHELITLVERAYGPGGQTEKFLLEKARRDSRILTIYEGTNEVQRFLILKDLIAQAAAWPELPEHREEGPARTLAEWKNRLRSRVKEAAKLLGDACWSDAMLQPALFPLAEMAGEILKLDCIYYRMEWLEARKALLAQGPADYVPAMLAAGRRAADRSVLRLSHLLLKYEATWEQVKTSMDMPEVRAADAALDAMEMKAVAPRPSPGVLDAPVRILSIVRPVADLSPSPRLTEGAIREIVWRIDPEDLAGLSQVLDLKAESGPRVIVDVLMPGGPEHEQLLRSAAGALADGLHRLAIDPAAGPGQYVKTVRDLEAIQQYDLIITGADCLDGDQSLGAYLAGGLKRLHYRKERIEAKPDGTGLNHVALPAVIGITSAAHGPVMNMAEAVRSAFSTIRTMKPERPVAIPGPSRFGLPTGVEASTKTVTTVKEAADYLKAYAASASAATAPEYSGELSATSALPKADAAWAMLDPQEQKSNLAVLRACRLAADVFGREAHAVIAAPRSNWPQLLGLAQANGCARAFCVDTGEDRLSNQGKRELVRAVMKTHAAPFIAAGKEWAGSFAYVAGETASVQNSVRLLSGVIEIKKQEAGVLSCALPAYEGKLVRRENLAAAAAFITVAEQAEFPVPTAGKAFAAFVLGLAIDSEWLMPLRPVASPTLSQADVIINLGYGIKDRAGFALAEELRKKLEAMGLAPLFGATRKVTQDLKLLPLDAQIGQTGVRVNPRLIIALGVSGAPQHIDYISARAEILCFNKDADAPLMKLNQTRPSPKVHPIAGDLFVTIRELIEKLG
jgi:electron transfer flavoprotein alpha subunit